MKSSKKFTVFLCTMFLLLGVSFQAQATLINNSDGTITQTRNDGSMLMWLTDANYAETSGYDDTVLGADTSGKMYWQDAVNFVQSLNDSVYAGHSDWRLPQVLPVNGSTYDVSPPIGYDGSKDQGYNITSPNSEMSYLYYEELGNLGYYDTSGNLQPGYGFNNTDDFANIMPGRYWTGSDYASYSSYAFDFTSTWGKQGGSEKVSSQFYVWAVRDVAPAAVPEPASLLLLGSGLAGLLGISRKRAK